MSYNAQDSPPTPRTKNDLTSNVTGAQVEDPGAMFGEVPWTCSVLMCCHTPVPALGSLCHYGHMACACDYSLLNSSWPQTFTMRKVIIIIMIIIIPAVPISCASNTGQIFARHLIYIAHDTVRAALISPQFA